MGDPAVVGGEGLEDVAEEPLPVIVDQLEDLHAGFNMAEGVSHPLVLLEILDGGDPKPCDLVAD